MLTKKSFLLFVIIALIISAPVIAEETNENAQTVGNVAAVVNGEQIMVSEVDQFANTQQLIMSLFQTNQEFAQLVLQTDAGRELIKEFQKKKLDQLITQKLLQDKAEEMGITLTDEEKNNVFEQHINMVKQQNQMSDEQLTSALQQQGINSIDDYKKLFLENNKRGILVNKLQKDVINEIEVSEEEMKTYYDENQDKFKTGEQVKASHILLEDEEKAQDILSKLENGADFTEMARENSTGPSAENGGDLGYFSKGDMVPAFEEKAFNMDTGDISDPVKTQYGYHIIKVTDKKEAGLKTFTEVKEQIKQSIRQNRQQKVWNDYVQELREKADIEIKM